MKIKLIIIFLCLMPSLVSFAQKKPEPFADGDRVVFAGNSITEAGFYETYIWLYYITHFPERKITVYNGGIGGDVARQIYLRMDSDLLAVKPTVLSVSFGMNDSRYFEYWMQKDRTDSVRKSAIDTSYKWFEKIRDKVNAYPGIKKIVMSSSPYDETVKNGKDPFWGKFKTMEGIVAFQKEAAVQNNWSYVDLFYPMTYINTKGQETDTAFTITGPDRIHPGNAGHFVMAYLFLKSQGLANKPVSNIVINAGNKKVVRADNATIREVNKTASGISFRYLARSLPFPMDSSARVWENPQKQYEALKLIPFVKEFDEEMLTVQGLHATGNYVLKIDGSTIKNFTGAELNEGINLALLSNTPQYRQAVQIAALQWQHKELEDKMRGFYWVSYNYLLDKGWFFRDSPAITDSVMAKAKTDWAIASKKDQYLAMKDRQDRVAAMQQMNVITDKMYALAQPVEHTVTIQKNDQ
ncbi:MAG: SGNH/GDSL hydrolase family protein [Chitinophagaceae bacterium]|nr:SGNH/GDSL hydrolase family protein [Chitinophagaceae bacterium]